MFDTNPELLCPVIRVGCGNAKVHARENFGKYPFCRLFERRLDSRSDDEDRPIARRKKGHITNKTHQCSICDKQFNRLCDLSKHEKTHSRQFGFLTEKNLERHINEKHSTSPLLYKCHFCTYKSRRRDNCNDHMERIHG